MCIGCDRFSITKILCKQRWMLMSISKEEVLKREENWSLAMITIIIRMIVTIIVLFIFGKIAFVYHINDKTWSSSSTNMYVFIFGVLCSQIFYIYVTAVIFSDVHKELRRRILRQRQALELSCQLVVDRFACRIEHKTLLVWSLIFILLFNFKLTNWD